jgi:hypothetical protein
MPVPGTALFRRLAAENRLVVSTEDGFLRNALFYASSCSRCFYRPTRLTEDELEQGLLALRQRLATLRETVRRSLVGDPAATAFLLAANLQFRRDTLHMARAWSGNGNTQREPRPRATAARAV